MLRIDLLPQRVRNARTNRRVVMVIVVLLIAAVLGIGSWSAKQKVMLGGLADELATAKEKADAVRSIESDTGSIRSRLAPIADKVNFIEQADECGYPYWECFYEVAEYIYGGAELRFFGIMGHQSQGLVGSGAPEDLFNQQGPAGTTDCAFGVTVKDTNECARFILNLIRCPMVSGLRISGDVPSGRQIAAHWPELVQQWNLPAMSIPVGDIQGLDLGGGAGAGGGMMGGMGPGGSEMMGGMGAMGAPPGGGMGPSGAMGMMAGPGIGGAGMGGGRGGMGVAGQGLVSQPRLDSSIDLLITCQLNNPVYVPSPPGVGAAAAAGPAGAGAMGPGMGMPGMGPSAGGMPGGPPGAGGMGEPGMAPEGGEEGIGGEEEDLGLEEGGEEGGL